MPTFRFAKKVRLIRNLRLFLNLEGGIVREAVSKAESTEQSIEPTPPLLVPHSGVEPNSTYQSPKSKRPVAQSTNSEPSFQQALQQRQQLENKRLALKRIETEIAGKKSVTERQASKKKFIETQQEIFRLQDEIYALSSIAEGVTEDQAIPQSVGQQRVGPLPDFMVIGAQKCGTSTFYHSLTLHPHVEPAALKELHYFDNHFSEGIEWYRRCFPTPKWKEGRKTITGEATPAYMFCPQVPERVAEYVPDAKLIVLLRNPVDRAYSQYHHQMRLNAENLNFEAAIRRELEKLEGNDLESEGAYYRGRPRQNESSYLSRGAYADQLSRWLNFFDREQIFVVKSEDLFQDVPGTLKSLTNFLELPDWKVPEIKSRNIGRYKSSMYSTTRQWLEKYFEPHNQRLYELLDRDLDW